MPSRRALTLACALALSSTHVSAFGFPPTDAARSIAPASINEPECADAPSQQRRAVVSTLLTFTSAALTTAAPAYAGLLDDYGADPNVDKQPEKKKEQARNKGKAESNLEPNLRSNYYYPTNKGEFTE